MGLFPPHLLRRRGRSSPPPQEASPVGRMLTTPAGGSLPLDLLPWPSEEVCGAFVERCMAGPASWRFWSSLFLEAQEDPSTLALLLRLLERPLFALKTYEWGAEDREEALLQRLGSVLSPEEVLTLAQSLLTWPPASLSPSLLDAYVDAYPRYRGMPPSWWIPLLQGQKGAS